MLFASTCLIFGHAFASYALKHGNGGLISAVIQVNALFQLLLEVIVYMRIPTLIEILALAIGFTGAAVMANK